MNRKSALRSLCLLMLGIVLSVGVSSCNDGKSYSDLLKEETRAVNWYLAQQRVIPFVPADSVFEIGPNAPYYRMDSEGEVYMRVLSMGDMSNRPRKGQTVYFRFTRTNLKDYANGGKIGDAGDNEADMSYSSWSLIYGNTTLPSTVEHGTGLQIPLNYLGYNCEVDLVVKSVAGRSGDISECIPFLYTNLKFFQAEY